ncbi:MAG: hypothetical protein IPN66_06025 [Candidatus Competibacteraceae bacterium]|nr:hypothetical protein [Candidatus Competibacteraceae bacterium]
MKPSVEINDTPGTTVITFDGGGKELGREVVKGHFIDPETVCCALGIAAVFAGIALTILFF